jgi:hypothetical protein
LEDSSARHQLVAFASSHFAFPSSSKTSSSNF